MKKNLLLFSVVCLMFFTISYTYSVFSNKVVGNISATSGDWKYAFNVTDGTVENDYYKIGLSGTSGSFNVVVDASGSNKDVSYLIKLDESNLSNDVKFYRDSSYLNEITDNVYSGTLDMNTSSTITIYWKSSSSVSGNLFVESEGTIYYPPMMKNGSSADTEFWSDTYKSYISTITFDNNLSNLPSSCTGDSDLCWDVSYDSEQEKKVYGYLVDSGSTDSSSNTLYNLYIVSEAIVFAPSNCDYMFYYFTNLISIDFNNNFNTSKVTDMKAMFFNCSSLTSLNVSSFDTSNVTDMKYMFNECSSLTNLDLSSFDTSNVTDMSLMFYYCSSLTSLNLSSFNTSKVTYMRGMFRNCSSLTNLDVSSFNTSNVTNMSDMFEECKSITSLNLSSFNTSNVTTMYAMFKDCLSLTSLNVSSFNTSNVTDMRWMFLKCSSLTSLDLSNFNTSRVTNMSEMFWSCQKLTSIDLSNFNTSNVTNMSGMFHTCSSLTSLDLSSFNTSNVTKMDGMFSSCSSLTSLDLRSFNTSNVTDMSYMFRGCSSLTSLDLSSFNTSNVTNMSYMFHSCSSITSLDISGFNTSKVANMSFMFYGCSSLTTTINIMSTGVTDYSYMFYNATTNDGACITVNYIAAASTLVDNMIATKSSTSNVVKGSVIS